MLQGVGLIFHMFIAKNKAKTINVDRFQYIMDKMGRPQVS